MPTTANHVAKTPIPLAPRIVTKEGPSSASLPPILNAATYNAALKTYLLANATLARMNTSKANMAPILLNAHTPTSNGAMPASVPQIAVGQLPTFTLTNPPPYLHALAASGLLDLNKVVLPPASTGKGGSGGGHLGVVNANGKK